MAACTVRRWAKVFRDEHNLVFPSCMDAMRYDPPDSIYKALKLNKAPLENKMEKAEEAGRNCEKAKINYAVSRDLLTHKNKVPAYFTYYNRSEGQPGSLTREEFWFMLDHVEREELIRENYEDAVEVTVAKIRTKTARDHYQASIRHIKGGQDALRQHMRAKNNVHQRAVDTFFLKKRAKRRANQMAADLETDGIVLSDLDESEFL